MSQLDLEALLDAFAGGELSRDEALARLRSRGVEDLGFARIDKDRARRRGFPEVIFGLGKSDAQVVEIFTHLAAENPNVLCTRASAAAAETLGREFSELRFDALSGTLSLHRDTRVRGEGSIAVVSAGTSDQKAAREAEICAEVMGNEVHSYRDVGVAGLHRILACIDEIRSARVIICVAGLEAALPSVVAGLVERPVIAVPTSVGYGASFGGVAALLGCLNACSAGVTTVNIDNGFGAAYAASLMIRRPS